jgi:hypothetical protein
MSFNELKKKSKNNMTDLIKKMEDQIKKTDYKDDRYWRPEIDKSGNGFAIIRFLPEVENEDCPWAKVYSHTFRGPGGWYIENCLTTISQKDPVTELNTQLWNSGVESDKNLARDRKRKLNYTSNIYIVSDPSNPQNEGKVFLYKYGSKIFEKLQEVMKPEFKDEEAVNPFDFWKGANFRLKIRKVAGYTNYDKSEFDSSSPLCKGDDAELEKVWKSQYPLTEFTNSSNFKTHQELKDRLYEVLGGDIRAASNVGYDKTAEDISESDIKEKKPQDFKSKKLPEQNVDEETDALDYFSKLAEES